MENVSDKWNDGSAYEDFMGRWSRELAPRFVEWLEVPEDAHWLDVGCGTGALTAAICGLANPASVVGCDPAETYIQYARTHSSSECASFEIGGTGSLPSRHGGFGSVTSLLALNFFPDPDRSISEMKDVTATDGTISSCVWDYSDRMEFLRLFWDAALRVDPKAAELDEGSRFPICEPNDLTSLFREAGLRSVRCEPLDIATDFASFDEYWKPFLGGPGPAPSYVASLDGETRTALQNHLDETLPRDSDGSIRLIAGAWAVRGRVD
jgi:ubiquinone/menaquinone biosynthesis C-methylase UbiE